MTPTSEANKAKISEFWEKIGDLVGNLMCRWQDEKEYEDINDYQKVLESEMPQGWKIKKMTKRPFGFHFTIGTDAVYAITMSANGSYAWKRVS